MTEQLLRVGLRRTTAHAAHPLPLEVSGAGKVKQPVRLLIELTFPRTTRMPRITCCAKQLHGFLLGESSL